MSINSVPVNVDNSFIHKNADNLDNILGQSKADKTEALAEKQSANVDAEQPVQKNNKKSIVAERIAESSKEQKNSSEELEKALDIVASFFQNTSKQVGFSSDNSAGKTVITIIDKQTQEVINQFPNEKIISMAEKIQALHQEVESISGLLIDSHV